MSDVSEGINRLIAWNEARIEYEFALERKRPKSDLNAKWNAAMASFAALTGIENLGEDEREMEFCDYMREWHEELPPPLIAGFNRACLGQ